MSSKILKKIGGKMRKIKMKFFKASLVMVITFLFLSISFTPVMAQLGNVIYTVPSPERDYSAGLAWDGKALWVSGAFDGMIYHFDPFAGNVLKSFHGPTNYLRDMAWDGTNLWVASWNFGDRRIFKLNPLDGSVITSFPAPFSGHPDGLAWDGQHLWIGEESGDIYKINPSTGLVVYSFSVPYEGFSNPRGLAWDGENIWAGYQNAGLIKKHDITTGSVLASFASPSSGYQQGLAWDGTYLWSTGGDNNIYQIEVVAEAPTIVLAPKTATNPLWSTHTLEALVKDQNGNPMNGATVTFTVTGENPQTGTAVTNSSGIATWSYVGESLGIDTIIASTDSIISEPATKKWELVNTPGRIVAWGGYNSTSFFNFSILSNGLYPVGTFYYSDRAKNLNLWSNQITGLMISSDKKKAVFTGKVKIGGVAGYRFEVYVNDNGNPGTNDKFRIRVYDPANTLVYTSNGTLFTGNIQIYP